MTSPTKPNAALAYRVLDHIDAHPEQWQQESWISRPDGAGCGTAGCFAGWASMLSGDKPHWWSGPSERTDTVTVDGCQHFLGERAAELLGIPDEDADDLFEPHNTRADLGRLVEKIFGLLPGGAA
jgi:hypothetical protein